MVGPYFFEMEKQQKKKKGVQIKYNTDEERKDAIQRSKTKYMLNKEWFVMFVKTVIIIHLLAKGSMIKGKIHQRYIRD